MWDRKRKIENELPVIRNIIIHHSAGSRCNGYTADQIFDLFNLVGFERGYEPYGYDFDTGYSKDWGMNYHTCKGKISYCEYHGVIYEISPERTEEPDLSNPSQNPQKIAPEYGFIPLIDNPMWNAAGSLSEKNKEIDFVSLAYCFAGDFEHTNIPESMIEYFIKLFRKGSPLSWITDRYKSLELIGHKNVDPTDCPGKYLYTYIPRIKRETGI